MRGFRYKYGDKPLDGYTIQRAAGRGGFGEVYYAISDSGREVALKVVQGYEQIELRGVSQCMNLKSPHLVTIFDVKHNDESTPFVIMEFVSGPSLRQLLDESPSGLGMQKTAFFLREIAKGLTYLHECGIVHRDLKPGNIFYENGYVKIGDYGLSKAMAASQHSGQTVTVGTVHYMAPEIGVGKYDRSIDIYALGVMLYEMLTGQVPYLGGSAGEILMKHMTAEPDVSSIEEPFASVIKKAMARDPQQRYQSVQEIVEAVFGAEHIQQSVSCFSPDSLSMIAQRVAERVAVGGGSATPPPLSGKSPNATDPTDRVGAWADRFGQRMTEFGQRMGQWGEDFGRRMGNLGSRTAPQPPLEQPPREMAPTHCDPLSTKARLVQVFCTVAVIGVAMALLRPHDLGNHPGTAALAAACAIVGATFGLRLAQKRILPQLANEGALIQHVAVGGLGTIFMLLVSLPLFLDDTRLQSILSETGAAIIIPLLFLDWMSCARPDRGKRISLGHAVKAALFGFIVSIFAGGSTELAIAVLAGTSLVVQVLAPWDPTAARRRKTHPGQAPRLPGDTPLAHPLPPPPPQGPPLVPGRSRPSAVAAPSLPFPGHLPGSVGRHIPPWVRALWWIVTAIALASGVATLVYAGNARMSAEDFAIAVSCGVGLLLLGAMSFFGATQTVFRGWWRYLIRPGIQWACATTVVTSAVLLAHVNTDSETMAIGAFFIVFPAIALLVVSFLPVPEPRFLTGRPTPAALPASLHEVHPAARLAWLIGSAIALALGIAFLVAASDMHREEFGIFTGFGLGFLLQAGMCLRRGLQKTYEGWWSYLIRPTIQWACVTTALVSAFVMGNSDRLPGEEAAIGVFFIVFPALVLIITAFVTVGGRSQAAPQPAADAPQSTPPATDPNVPLHPPMPLPPPLPVQFRTDRTPSPIDLSTLPARAATGLIALVGGLALFSSMAIGLAVAADLPGMLAAGLPDPAVAKDIAREAERLGIQNWVGLLRILMIVLCGVGLFASAVLLMIARRSAGMPHMIRSLFGIVACANALFTLSSAFYGNWPAAAGRPFPAALEIFLNQARSRPVIAASVILMTGIVLLVWPPRRLSPPQSAS